MSVFSKLLGGAGVGLTDLISQALTGKKFGEHYQTENPLFQAMDTGKVPGEGTSAQHASAMEGAAERFGQPIALGMGEAVEVAEGMKGNEPDTVSDRLSNVVGTMSANPTQDPQQMNSFINQALQFNAKDTPLGGGESTYQNPELREQIMKVMGFAPGTIQ